MKRSNRLVLLIGVFLALIAFVLILFTMNNNKSPAEPNRNETTMVVAVRDVALGETFQDADVDQQPIDVTLFPSNGIKLESLVIGQIARAPVTAGQAITQDVLNPTGVKTLQVPQGYVAVSVQVDQTTGVGTIIKTGDYVDIVTEYESPDKWPLVVTATPRTAGSPRPNASPAPVGFTAETLPYNPASAKTVIQGVQVLGTLLPPPPAQQGNATPQPGGQATTLNGQQEIVILAVSAQDAEVIKFNQMQGNISLVLRSSKDCQVAEESPTPAPSGSLLPSPSPSPSGSPGSTVTTCPIIPTTGITLRRLVDDRGVLPPTVVQVIQPTPYPSFRP